MIVDFCLTLKDAVVNGRQIDYMQLIWREDLTPSELADKFNQWLYDEDFIHRNLPDLDKTGLCLLSINPH